MKRLAIRRLRYSGKLYEYESPRLPDGLCIVEGENGSGKTTFSDLVYFGLGGDPSEFRVTATHRHKEIAEDSDNYVDLDVVVGDAEFRVRRLFARPDVLVSKQGEDAVTSLPLNRQGDSETYSDWLLERLGIPVVTLTKGSYRWKLGIKDVMRLIYHDQAVDRHKVFKAPDQTDTFVTDSKYVRKTIFEVVSGKAHQQLHAIQGDIYDAKIALVDARAQTKVLDRTLRLVWPDAPAPNTEHLNAAIIELQEQLERLNRRRSTLTTRDIPTDEALTSIDELKRDVAAAEGRCRDLRTNRDRLLSEVGGFQYARRQLSVEAEHVKKIMLAHEHFGSIFDATCPRCGRDLPLKPGTCMCGGPLNEASTMSHAFTIEDYSEILRSKVQNIRTIDASVEAATKQLGRLESAMAAAEESAEGLTRQLRNKLRRIESRVDMQEVDRVTDKLVSTQRQLAALQGQLRTEHVREELDQTVARSEAKVHTLEQKAAALRAQADVELAGVVGAFNDKYSELMRSAVPECRIATLTPDYEPQINHGEYLQASADVPKRLIYYLTLMSVSLSHPDIPFPRFLLVDTPENAGIDEENLNAALERIKDALPDESTAQYQVILTTGPGRYPPGFEAKVVIRLGRSAPLLRRRPPESLPVSAGGG